MFDVTKGRRTECKDGGAHLGVRYDLDPEDVGEPWPAVVSEGAEYQILALLVEDQDPGEHV